MKIKGKQILNNTITESHLNLKTLLITSITDNSTVLDIQGVNGQLFMINDSLVGDIFTVSDISGMPLLNVNSSGLVSVYGDIEVSQYVKNTSGNLTFSDLYGTYTLAQLYGGSITSTDLSTGLSQRVSTDVSLSQGISTDAYNLSVGLSQRVSTDNSITYGLSTEIYERVSGDTSLSLQIDNLIQSNIFTDSLSVELSQRVSTDGVLSTSLSQRVSTDGALSTSLSQRVSTDVSLSQTISTGDYSLSSNLSVGLSQRISTDVSLSTNILNYLPLTAITDTKGLTGFIDGNNITVTYNWTNRTITLNGSDLSYYWLGVKKVLGNGTTFTSSAHTETVGMWFLYSTDGINVTWSQSGWSFDALMVAYVNYKSTSATSFAIKECHGIMDWKTHEELHSQIGTYLKSGGKLTAGTYTENSATDANTTPGFDAAVVKDEDCETNIGVWTEGTYTTMYVNSTTNTSTFNVENTTPFIATTNTFIQVNNVSAGTMSVGQSGRWYNVYQIIIPTSIDTDSAKYRMIMLQPQKTFTSLASAQAEDSQTLSLGGLTSLSPEFVIYARITYVTANGNSNIGKCAIATGGITYILGNKMSQTSVSGVAGTNHTALSNLTWNVSGHIGDVNTVAGFDSSGNAVYYTFNNILSVEESTRLVGDTSLTTRVSIEEYTRSVAISNGTVADTSLTTRISLEEYNRSVAVSTELSNRTTADISLTTRISVEESTRTVADTSLTTRVSVEESTRAAAISQRVSTDVSLSTADTSLTTRISVEESTRIAVISNYIPLVNEGTLNVSTAKKIRIDNTIVNGASGLQFAQYSDGDNPGGGWYSHLIMNHGNPTGYYVDLMVNFDQDVMFMRRKVGGVVQPEKRFVMQGDSTNFSNLYIGTGNSTKVTISDGGYIGIDSININDNLIIRAKGNGGVLMNYGVSGAYTGFYDGTTQIGYIYSGETYLNNKLVTNGDAVINGSLTTSKLSDTSRKKEYVFENYSGGWVRIAKLSVPSTGEAVGTISIANTFGYSHSVSTVFSFGVTYRDIQPWVTQLGSTNTTLPKVRIVSPTNADTDYYIEVYYTAVGGPNLFRIQLSNEHNVELLNSFTNGEVPAGYLGREFIMNHYGISARSLMVGNNLGNGNNRIEVNDAGYLSLTTTGNELTIGKTAVGGELYINYRQPNSGSAPTTYIWNDGTSTGYAEHRAGFYYGNSFRLYQNDNNIQADSSYGMRFNGSGYVFFAQTGPTYFSSPIISRENIRDDSHEYLTIGGGTSNQTYFPYGNIGIGTYPTSSNRLKISSVSSTVDIMSLVGYTNSEFIFSGSWNGTVDYLGLRHSSSSVPQIILSNNGNVGIGFGVGANVDTSYKLSVYGKTNLISGVENSNTLSIYTSTPTVTTNSTNYNISQNIIMSDDYNINSGKTDSGYRLGLNIQAFNNDGNLKGTLYQQLGQRIQYGHYTSATGGGIINNVIGLNLNYLSYGNLTINNAWSIYSEGIAKLYHEGDVLIGNSTDNGYKLQIEGTPEYQITWKRTSVSKLWGLGSDGSGTYIKNLTDDKLPLYITNTGSVLINTTTPSSSYKLDVNGLVNVTGSLNVTNNIDALNGTISGGNVIVKDGTFTVYSNDDNHQLDIFANNYTNNDFFITTDTSIRFRGYNINFTNEYDIGTTVNIYGFLNISDSCYIGNFYDPYEYYGILFAIGDGADINNLHNLLTITPNKLKFEYNSITTIDEFDTSGNCFLFEPKIRLELSGIQSALRYTDVKTIRSEITIINTDGNDKYLDEVIGVDIKASTIDSADTGDLIVNNLINNSLGGFSLTGNNIINNYYGIKIDTSYLYSTSYCGWAYGLYIGGYDEGGDSSIEHKFGIYQEDVNSNNVFYGKVAINTSSFPDNGSKLVVNGTVLSTGFIKLNGTSSQFLKADGSVDSTTYVGLSFNEYTATSNATEYVLSLNNQTNILGTLPTGVTTTITLPTAITGQTNESVLHFNTGAGLPTIAYNGFTPVWLNGVPISLKINKSYNIVFEQIRTATNTWIVKTSWGEY